MTNMRAKLHEPFEIELKSEGLSGYEWRPVFKSADLKLLGKRREANLHSFGSPGKEVFRFEPLRSGDYGISFELVRPFENKSIDQRQFSLHVD
jgi:predicted secreted protein